MTGNIMQQYVKEKKDFLKYFTKLFLEEMYNEKISNELIKSYIEARLYNFGDKEHTFFYKRIYGYMSQRKDELGKSIKEKDLDILDLNLKMYQLVFYADGVRPVENIEILASTICEKRKDEFAIKTKKGLENKFCKLIKTYSESKEKFLADVETKDFNIEIDKYTNIDNTYMVDLNYNFKLPYIYSNKIINEVYNEGTINEDKLIIEYMLLVAECIRDAENRQFRKKIFSMLCKNFIRKRKENKANFKYYK